MKLIIGVNIPNIDRNGRSYLFHFRDSLIRSLTQYKKVYFEDNLIDIIKAKKEYTSQGKKIFFLTKEEINTLYGMSKTAFRDKGSSILKNARPLEERVIRKPATTVVRVKKPTKKEIIEEFNYIPTKKLQSKFSFKELRVLSDVEYINHDSIKSMDNVEDRVVALRCYLVPKKTVLNIILLLLSKSRCTPYVTLKMLDTQLSTKYANPNKRNKTPYIKFLRDLINKGLLDDSLYEFKEAIKVDKTPIYNVIRLKKSILKSIDN